MTWSRSTLRHGHPILLLELPDGRRAEVATFAELPGEWRCRVFRPGANVLSELIGVRCRDQSAIGYWLNWLGEGVPAPSPEDLIWLRDVEPRKTDMSPGFTRCRS